MKGKRRLGLICGSHTDWRQCMANFVCRCFVSPVSGYAFPLKENLMMGLGPVGDLLMGLGPTGRFKDGTQPCGRSNNGTRPYGRSKDETRPCGRSINGTRPYRNLRMGLGLVGDLTLGLGPTEYLRMGLSPVGDLTMGLGPTEDLRMGLGPVGDLRMGLGSTEGLRMGLGPMGDLTIGLGPTEDLRMGLGLVGDLTMRLGPTEDLGMGLGLVGDLKAYRDVLNEALAALSVARHARRLWTLLNRAVSNCLEGVLGYPLCLRKTLLWMQGFVLCPVSLFETPQLCIAETTLKFVHDGSSFRNALNESQKELREECMYSPGGRLTAVVENGRDPSFGRRNDCAGVSYDRGSGHVLLVHLQSLQWKD
ncbi:hypothetical protein CRG98_030326 [Punica granatum]|uniref:Uncharacterized protein n=1 Tax=Punica granatum TaxID=22663 RepID=A0A2I0IZU7_PUNGR|nr:hypothetical protein CRG98_030326 [Punica granatum]